MPQFNRRELDERSRQYGFNRDTFEKVLRLKIILEYPIRFSDSKAKSVIHGRSGRDQEPA